MPLHLKKYRNLYQKEAQRFDELSVDLICATVLANNSVELLNNISDKTGKNSLALVRQSYEIGTEIETVSLFQQLDGICKNAELYACSNPQRAIPKRSQMIDMMGYRNEIIANMFSLSEREQLKVGNQITKLMLGQLGDWTKMNEVIEGKRLLADFVGKTTLCKLKTDISEITNNPRLLKKTTGLKNGKY